jgi:nucleotide-binding universal stress UspA family protein
MATITKILCPVDLSPASAKVADYAKHLASKLGAEVLCLYVAPRMNRYAEYYVPEQEMQKVVQSILSGSKERMNTFTKDNFQDVPATAKVIVGYAPEEIIKVVKEEDIDLIVMGTHGRRGINLIIFGSVAEHVVKASPVPVLTVRP